MSKYGSWDQGVFTDNAGNVYQDQPVMGEGGGWSRAVAADGASLGDLFKSLFNSFSTAKPNGPTQPAMASAPQVGSPPVMNRRGALPVFLRPNAGVPGMPNTTFAAATGVNGEPLASFAPGSVPMMARTGSGAPVDTVDMTLNALKQRAPTKGFILG